MGAGTIAFVALLCGPVLGWLLVGLGCGLPGLRYSSACGHNAGLWLVITIPLGVAAVAWALLRWDRRRK